MAKIAIKNLGDKQELDNKAFEIDDHIRHYNDLNKFDFYYNRFWQVGLIVTEQEEEIILHGIGFDDVAFKFIGKNKIGLNKLLQGIDCTNLVSDSITADLSQFGLVDWKDTAQNSVGLNVCTGKAHKSGKTMTMAQFINSSKLK